jgi:pimeloyl-ACP methyl ester carboxylesterase
MARHARDAVAVLEALAPGRRVVVVGHSMGGFVASRFAQRHPDRVDGLVLLDGGPPMTMPRVLMAPRVVRFLFDKQLPKADTTYRDVDDYFAKVSKRAGSYEELDPELVRWAFAIDLAGPPGQMKLTVNRPMLLDDAVECFNAAWRAEAIKELTVPTRLLLCEWGKKLGAKPLYRKDPAPSTLSPAVSVKRVEGIDHAQIVWHPEAVAAIDALIPA